MQRARLAASGALVGAVLLGTCTGAAAASFNCLAPSLTPAETTICQDPQLSRSDEQAARRLATLLRRVSFGQYLGLRYWQNRQADGRNQCGPDRACLAAAYRAQNRFFDRLQLCIDAGAQRRVCLRSTLSGGGRETVRR